jgi:RNA polymerase sigma factor (sigma-70 family)
VSKRRRGRVAGTRAAGRSSKLNINSTKRNLAIATVFRPHAGAFPGLFAIVSATTTPTPSTRTGLLGGKSPLLRLQSDERLIAVLRSGNGAAFDVLFGRYRTRLLGFCRHMLGSREDAEDVLQEVFAAAYNAILADQREINVRPWLYRIARNRCLNHLRRPTADGTDTMDEHVFGHGVTAADIVHKRADVRHLLKDVQKLPESQRTALLLREIDALSYDQIAEAMETTIPSVKSLLVRARMSLAEAAEARQLTCDDVRRELAEIAEGLRKASPPVRRHLRECETCGAFRVQLRKTNTAMALAFPVGPLLILKKLLLVKIGSAVAGGAGGGAAAGGAAGATGAATAGGAGIATGAGVATSAGVATATGAGMATSAGVATGAGLGAVASKAVAGVAVTAIIAGGAVEAKRVVSHPQRPAAVTAPAPAPAPKAVNPSGGASLAGATPELVEGAKDEIPAPAAGAEASTAGPTGATGPQDALPEEDGGVPSTVPGEEAEEPAPATGSDADMGQEETGGAAVPPAGATGSKGATGATGVSGSSVAGGTTGTTGPPGPVPTQP